MANPFLSEITMFGGTFAPRGWAFCSGQLISKDSNDALFELIGTIYGGDGRSSMGLPDLRGRTPLGEGQGVGLSNHPLASRRGVETVTLTPNQMPQHNHGITVSTGEGPPNAKDPNGNLLSDGQTGNFFSTVGGNSSTSIRYNSGASGGTQPHNNMQPYLIVNYIIATAGGFPARN